MRILESKNARLRTGVFHGLFLLNDAQAYDLLAVAIQEKVCAPNHHDTVALYSNISMLYFAIGNMEKAREYYQKYISAGGK